MDFPALIQAARGEIPCSLLLENARIVNVYSGEIIQGHAAIYGHRIAALGKRPALKTVDLQGQYLAPGLIDAHVHIESSMTCPFHYARAVLPHGTTAVAADPHEIANVMGTAGISYMLEASRGLPVDFFLTLPSCVPATHMETSGASISAQDLEPFFSHPRVAGLAEMMNFPGVIHADPGVLEKMAMARKHRRPIDGHAPLLSGAGLQAYLAAGAASDHECTSPEEALEKLESGMRIMIRQGTGAKNLEALLPMVTEKNSRRVMLCSDDRHPHDILERGHLDSMVAFCISRGVDPVTAVRMATLNPAEYFGLSGRGGIAPGNRADLLVIPDINGFSVRDVYCGGEKTVENRVLVPQPADPPHAPESSTMNLASETPDFSIKAAGGRARVMELIPGQILTGRFLASMPEINGCAVPDPARDILKIAVVERHHKTGNVGLGFVKGFGLRQGALASSVAHDSHNIIVAGENDQDMQAAVQAVAGMGGGLAAACNGKVRACLPLPIAGLMSLMPMEEVRASLDILHKTAHEMGCSLIDPFMALSFLALPVIPQLKITDLGLVDVDRFEIISLFE